MIGRSCYARDMVALSVLAVALTCSRAGALTREVGVGKEYGDIKSAMNASEDGDTVLVYPGTYTVYPAAGNYAVLQYGGRNICVTSTDPTDPAVVASTIVELGPEDEYSTCYSIVRFTNGETRDAILRGFTIRNGFDPYYGAGVRIVDATPTIENNVFQDNPGDGMGGAIYVRGNALIQNNTFLRNTAGFIGGGGIYVGGGAPIIRDNTFTENYCEAHASAIYSTSAQPEIYDNHFEGNTGSSTLRCDGDGASVHDNLFIRNTGIIGAAVVLYGTCDFHDNQVVLNRYLTNGGLILTAGTPTVRNPPPGSLQCKWQTRTAFNASRGRHRTTATGYVCVCPPGDGRSVWPAAEPQRCGPYPSETAGGGQPATPASPSRAAPPAAGSGGGWTVIQ